MNTSIIIALVTVALLFVCVFAGVHISFTLMSLSLWDYFGYQQSSTALSVLSTTAFKRYPHIYILCDPPLHAHGHHHAVSGSAGDLFKWAHKMLEKVPAGWLPPPLSATLCSRP